MSSGKIVEISAESTKRAKNGAWDCAPEAEKNFSSLKPVTRKIQPETSATFHENSISHSAFYMQ
ncbi:MAG: hypothetical protein FWD58_01635 [Firmicutes bacterium]|nr:hypothetical protein [Bacillota bacterium]